MPREQITYPGSRVLRSLPSRVGQRSAPVQPNSGDGKPVPIIESPLIDQCQSVNVELDNACQVLKCLPSLGVDTQPASGGLSVGATERGDTLTVPQATVKCAKPDMLRADISDNVPYRCTPDNDDKNIKNDSNIAEVGSVQAIQQITNEKPADAELASKSVIGRGRKPIVPKNNGTFLDRTKSVSSTSLLQDLYRQETSGFESSSSTEATTDQSDFNTITPVPSITPAQSNAALNIRQPSQTDTSRTPQPNNPIHYRRIGPNIMKIGEHSVTNRGVTEHISYSIPPPAAAEAPAANFFTQIPKLMQMNDGNIVFDANAHGLRIRSWIIPSPGHPNQVPNFAVDTFVAQSTAPGIRYNIMPLNLGAPVAIGAIQPAQLAALNTEALPNPRKFTNVLAPLLRLTNTQATRLNTLADFWNHNLEVYDNSAMYAKLFALAFHIHRLGLEGIVPQHANPNDDNFRYIRITDIIEAGADSWEDLLATHAFAPGALVFDWVHDFKPSQYLLFLVLSMPGPHFVAREGARDVPSRAYQLPAIPIIVVGKDAAPQMPAGHVYTAQQLIDFARILATKRHEYGAYERGCYMAAEIGCPHPVMIREPLPAIPAVGDAPAVEARAGLASPLTAYLDATPPRWPEPRGYNFLLRFLRQLPNVEIQPTAEYIGISSLPLAKLYRVIAVWNALIQSMSTTVLYSMNITGTLIQHALLDEHVNHNFNLLMHSSAIFVAPMDPTNGEGNANCNFHPIVSNLLHASTGIRTSACYYTNRTYNYYMDMVGLIGNANDFMAVAFPNTPPRVGSPLAVDCFLVNRPIEWGISNVGPTLDVTTDYVAGAAEDMGLYPYVGDNSFTNAATSASPYEIVPYAAAFVNAVSQCHGALAPRVVFNLSTSAVNVGRRPVWRPNDEARPWPYVNLPGACHPDVATIMTYDWQQELIMAPAIVEANQVYNGLVEVLLQYANIPAPRAGYLKTIRRAVNEQGAPGFTGMIDGNAGPRARQLYNNPAPNALRGRADPNVAEADAVAADRPAAAAPAVVDPNFRAAAQ